MPLADRAAGQHERGRALLRAPARPGAVDLLGHQVAQLAVGQVAAPDQPEPERLVGAVEDAAVGGHHQHGGPGGGEGGRRELLLRGARAADAAGVLAAADPQRVGADQDDHGGHGGRDDGQDDARGHGWSDYGHATPCPGRV